MEIGNVRDRIYYCGCTEYPIQYQFIQGVKRRYSFIIDNRKNVKVLVFISSYLLEDRARLIAFEQTIIEYVA